MLLNLDQASFNTLIAALRVYADLPDDHPLIEAVEPVAEPEGAPMALTVDEVDSLAEQLNCGDLAPRPHELIRALRDQGNLTVAWSPEEQKGVSAEDLDAIQEQLIEQGNALLEAHGCVTDT